MEGYSVCWATEPKERWITEPLSCDNDNIALQSGYVNWVGRYESVGVLCSWSYATPPHRVSLGSHTTVNDDCLPVKHERSIRLSKACWVLLTNNRDDIAGHISLFWI